MASVEEGSVVPKKEDKKEEKLIAKAVDMGFSDKEAHRMLRMYGGKRLHEILKRARTEGGALGSRLAMTRMTHVAMADNMFKEMIKTQGVSWMKIVEGVKVKLRLDLLMVYNGLLKGPKVKIMTRSQKEITVETVGYGMILNTRRDLAMFGLLPPHGREWSEWEPCFFAGDPSGKKSHTPLKGVADGCDTTKEQRALIEELPGNYKMAPVRRGPTGLPIALLKRAANDTIKLSGFEGKPGWQDGIDLRDGEHPEKAIALVTDDRARTLLERFWLSDKDEEDEEDDDGGGDIWDD